MHNSWVLDSVVFATTGLSQLRAFYEQVVGLEIAVIDVDGFKKADVSANHVNYRLGNNLLGFEEGPRNEVAELVLKVSDFEPTFKRLSSDLSIVRTKKFFFTFNDPDGRKVIVESL